MFVAQCSFSFNQWLNKKCCDTPAKNRTRHTPTVIYTNIYERKIVL